MVVGVLMLRVYSVLYMQDTAVQEDQVGARVLGCQGERGYQDTGRGDANLCEVRFPLLLISCVKCWLPGMHHPAHWWHERLHAAYSWSSLAQD